MGTRKLDSAFGEIELMDANDTVRACWLGRRVILVGRCRCRWSCKQ